MVVAVEPRAFDSCDGSGFRVERGVPASGAPEGAVVRSGAASACDTTPEGGGMPSESVPSVNPTEGEDGGVTSFVGAATKERLVKMKF